MPKLRLTQVHKDQMLTGGLEFFHITTPVSAVPTADRDTEWKDYFAQARVWERMVEVIQSRANVVIIGPLTESGFSFAVEHRDAINVTRMQDELQSLGTVSFSDDGQTTVDLSGVTLIEQLDFILAGSVDTFDGDTVESGDESEEITEDSPGETETSAAIKNLG